MCAYSMEQIRLNDYALLQLIQELKNTVTAKDFWDNEKMCIDVVTGELDSTLGKEATEVIFSFLERRFKTPRNKILAKIGDVNLSLELILGNGASILEAQILKKLHKKMEL